MYLGEFDSTSTIDSTVNNNLIHDELKETYINEQLSDEYSSENNEEEEEEESVIIDIFNFLKVKLFYVFWFFLATYTNIELYFNDKSKKIIEDVKLNGEKGNYEYFENNKIIAVSENFTNRKNYDFALRNHYTNIGHEYREIVLYYNKTKRKKISICDKHFISIYFTIDENDYEIKLDDNKMNYYLTNNIIDFNVIKYLMFENYNLDISNVSFNLVIIDNDSDVILLKETEFIKMFQKKYVKGTYE